MKIFIVFLGLLLVNVSITSYKDDFGRYIYLNRALDNIALECVEIAEDDPIEARAFADEMLGHTIDHLNGVKIRGYSCTVTADVDDVAVVFIRMDVEKLFRFPFSAVTSITAERSRAFQM